MELTAGDSIETQEIEQLEIEDSKSKNQSFANEGDKCQQCWESKNSSLRQRIHELLDHPNQSTGSRLIQAIVMFFIGVSTVQLIVSSVREWEDWEGWSVIEYIVSIFFTVELITRFSMSANKKIFCTTLMNWIDLLAILPFFFDVALSGAGTSVDTLRILRIVRLARIFRLLKVGRYLGFLKVFKVTLIHSLEPLVLLLIFVFLMAVIFGCIVATIEAGECETSSDPCLRTDGSVSPFKNYLVGIYWAITTLATVGYGDLFPVEGIGRFIANIAMITGILVFALPLAVIGSNFQNAFQAYDEENIKKAKAKVRSKSLIESSDKVYQKHHELIDEVKHMISSLKYKEGLALKRKDASLLHKMVEREMKDLSLFFDSTIQILRSAEDSILNCSDKLQDLLAMPVPVSEEAGYVKKPFSIPEEVELEKYT
jgi:voltage-gated potassium channel